MWTAENTIIEEGRICKYEILKGEQYITFKDFLYELKESRGFRKYFNQLLADVPFDAFFWECRAVKRTTTNQKFEFVVVESPTLARITENGSPFFAYFNHKKQAVTFKNLRKDAQLIVPTPQSSECYAHIADFVRKAPSEQQDIFWNLVGNIGESHLGNHKHWWSTSGLGVHWLHFRIDTVPKYYQYKPYRKER